MCIHRDRESETTDGANCRTTGGSGGRIGGCALEYSVNFSVV